MRVLVRVKSGKVNARWDNFPEGDLFPHPGLVEFVDTPELEIPQVGDGYVKSTKIVTRRELVAPTARQVRCSELLALDPAAASQSELVELVQLLGRLLG